MWNPTAPCYHGNLLGRLGTAAEAPRKRVLYLGPSSSTDESMLPIHCKKILKINCGTPQEVELMEEELVAGFVLLS